MALGYSVWLSDIKGFDGTRPRTLTLYEGLADRYVRPVIGSVRLDKTVSPLSATSQFPCWPAGMLLAGAQ